MTARRCCLLLAIGLALGAAGCQGNLLDGPSGPNGAPRPRTPGEPGDPGEPGEQVPLSVG